MKEILTVAISFLLVSGLIFFQLKLQKINHPNADLLCGLLNRFCSNSKAVRFEEKGKKTERINLLNHEKEKECAVHMRP